MLHDSYPVAELLGQISGSNAGSNSLVKIVGQIHGSNLSVKLLVESVRRIAGSNLSVKFLDQIPRSNLLVKSAGQTQPIHGPTRASLGARMGAPTDGLKTAKD